MELLDWYEESVLLSILYLDIFPLSTRECVSDDSLKNTHSMKEMDDRITSLYLYE